MPLKLVWKAAYYCYFTPIPYYSLFSLLIQPGQSPPLQHAGWVLGCPPLYWSGQSASLSCVSKVLALFLTACHFHNCFMPLIYVSGEPNTPMSEWQRERFHSICKQVSSLYGFSRAVGGFMNMELYCMKKAKVVQRRALHTQFHSWTTSDDLRHSVSHCCFFRN